ncbi:MAG TPA: hypothetical protein VF458_22610, partial [Ktedonobacteraceae bacterium]
VFLAAPEKRASSCPVASSTGTSLQEKLAFIDSGLVGLDASQLLFLFSQGIIQKQTIAIIIRSRVRVDNGLTVDHFLPTIRLASVTQATKHCKETHPQHDGNTLIWRRI